MTLRVVIMLFFWCQTDGKRKCTLLQLNWTKTTQWSQIWLIRWVWLLTELPNKQASMAQRRSTDKMPKSSARPAIGFPRDFSVSAGINHWICIQRCHALCDNYHRFISLCSTGIILLMSDWKKRNRKMVKSKRFGVVWGLNPSSAMYCHGQLVFLPTQGPLLHLLEVAPSFSLRELLFPYLCQ